jgi:integrase
VRRERAQRLLSEVDAHLLIRAAKPGRDRLLLQVAYYGALRVSELASLTWGQVQRLDEDGRRNPDGGEEHERHDVLDLLDTQGALWRQEVVAGKGLR